MDGASASSATGASASSSGYTTPYKFTGKELDKETNLYYFGARYYDARLGRWVSTDPALSFYISGKPNGGIFNPINIDLYRYAQNRPIVLIDPNGMWEDKSITVGYENKGVQRQADVNMGTVTKGDTLVKLAEMQLKTETGSNKFTGEDVTKKVEQIKQINGLKSDTIKVGQNLLLGASNDKVVGEQGIQQNNIDLLLMGGAAYGLTKAGIAGAGMIMDAALATDTGIKATLYGGLLASAARAGAQNGSLIPGIGNMMLQYGPQINQYGGAFISGYMPSRPSTFRNIKEAATWIIGYYTSLMSGN